MCSWHGIPIQINLATCMLPGSLAYPNPCAKTSLTHAPAKNPRSHPVLPLLYIFSVDLRAHAVKQYEIIRYIIAKYLKE